MLAVPFYFGNTLGEADNPELQHKVLQATFDLLTSDQGPILERYPEEKIPDVMIQGQDWDNICHLYIVIQPVVVQTPLLGIAT